MKHLAGIRTKNAHTCFLMRRQLAGSVTPCSFASPPRKGFAPYSRKTYSSLLSLELYNFSRGQVKRFPEKKEQKTFTSFVHLSQYPVKFPFPFPGKEFLKKDLHIFNVYANINVICKNAAIGLPCIGLRLSERAGGWNPLTCNAGLSPRSCRLKEQ